MRIKHSGVLRSAKRRGTREAFTMEHGIGITVTLYLRIEDHAGKCIRPARFEIKPLEAPATSPSAFPESRRTERTPKENPCQ